MIFTLEELAYKAVVKAMGTPAADVREGKYYKMIEKDGINLLDLGKCIKVEQVFPSYGNDGMGQIHFTFEKNNDNKLLWKSLYGQTIFGVNTNVIEYKKDKNT